MAVTRRFFIAGASAFGAFSGCRFLDPSGTFDHQDAPPASGQPPLKFGVISDIHIGTIADNPWQASWSTDSFRHTLEWFRDQDVDAVLIAGDMADSGLVEELRLVSETWYAVFPEDKAPNGKHVEKVFVLGNHDFDGLFYGDRVQRWQAKVAPHMDYAHWHRDNSLRLNIEKCWRHFFHEDYTPFFAKTIKGYTFLGQHWDSGSRTPDGKAPCPFGVALQDYLDTHALDPRQPFFYVQHPHPKDTCYGAWAWGHDDGNVTKVLSSHANAIAFSGHSHYSLTDERSIWQGAFTSVGTSSLRYTDMPYNQRLPYGYENTSTEGPDARKYKALKMMARYKGDDGQQGMIWTVHADRIVVQRREFATDAFLGPDWVMPLPVAEDKPFAFAARAKKAKAPQFAKKAKVTHRKISVTSILGEPKDCVELTFPAATAQAGARPYEYEITAYGRDGTSSSHHVLAEGFHQAPSHPRAKADSSCIVSLDRLPKDPVRFTVTPLDCWWNKGAPLELLLPQA